MDPLSVTASVIALLGAANKVYTVLESIRNADRGLQSLAREVVSLKGFLQSIEKALENCRDNPYALSHIDPALWKESKIALSDCQATLKQLSQVVETPRRPSRSNTLFRRARVAAELRSRAGDIASFREKISMSNLSLQTLLQVINVSLSLRGNESHERILRGLQELKDALKKSSQAATVSYSTLFLNEQDMSLVQHLKGLIRAADDFHASASTTASTVVGSQETRMAPSEFEDDQRSTCTPRLPSIKLKQIETYLSSSQQNLRPSTSGSGRKEGATRENPQQEMHSKSPPRGVDPNHTFSTIFIGGFSKIAQRALQQLDLQQAEELLKEALKWYDSSSLKDPSHHRHLQTQLALCSLLQGNRDKAQDLIIQLIDTNTEADTVPHQLLYALILLQLHEMDFEGARDNSKRLWEALQETCCTVLDANDAMRLLATSYQESGDSLLANAIEAEVPGLNLCDPVPKMVDFLVDCQELLVKSFGFQGCTAGINSSSVVQKMHNLPIAKKSSSLQMHHQLLSDGDIHLSEEEPSVSILDRGLPAKASQNSAESPLKTNKRSWSHFRTLFKARMTRAASSMDLSALYGTQDTASDTTEESQTNTDQKPCCCGRPKSIKRVKRSHSRKTNCEEALTGCDAPSALDDGQGSIASTQSTPNEPKTMDGEPDSNRNLRTEEWLRSQDGDVTLQSTTLNENNCVPEEGCSLQRQFSFQAGVQDCISSRFPEKQQATCHEMPNTEIFELMDTSSSVSLPTETKRIHGDTQPAWAATHPLQFFVPSGLDCGTGLSNARKLNSTRGSPLSEAEARAYTAMKRMSSEMESKIYDLLGHFASEEPEAENSETPSPIPVPNGFDASTLCNGSAEGNLSPSQRIMWESPDCLFGIGNDCRVPDLWKENHVPVQISSFSTDSDTDATHSTHPEYSPTPLRIRASKYRQKSEVKLSRGLKSRCEVNQSQSQDATLPLAKLCRRRNGLHKLPRRTMSTKPLSVITATKLRRLLFNAEKHGHEFDFGFNTARYSGPDAVIGPFTSLGDTDTDTDMDTCRLPDSAQPICVSTPQNTPIAVFT